MPIIVIGFLWVTNIGKLQVAKSVKGEGQKKKNQIVRKYFSHHKNLYAILVSSLLYIHY